MTAQDVNGGDADLLDTATKTGSWGDLVSAIDSKPLKNRAEALLLERFLAEFVPLLSSVGIELLECSPQLALEEHPFRLCRGPLGFNTDLLVAKASGHLAHGFLALVRKDGDVGWLFEPYLKISGWTDRVVYIEVGALIR